MKCLGQNSEEQLINEITASTGKATSQQWRDFDLTLHLAKICNLTKSNISPWVFSRFLNCTNDTKSRKASQGFLNIRTTDEIPITGF